MNAQVNKNAEDQMNLRIGNKKSVSLDHLVSPHFIRYPLFERLSDKKEFNFEIRFIFSAPFAHLAKFIEARYSPMPSSFVCNKIARQIDTRLNGLLESKARAGNGSSLFNGRSSSRGSRHFAVCLFALFASFDRGSAG